MGSPEDEVGRADSETLHQVTLSQDFYMGVFPVTQAEYFRVMGVNPSHFQVDAVDDENSASHPVEQVMWDEAVEFCRKLSERPEEKAAGRVYRLPTEAEWEYACRAGSQTTWCFRR
jgi:formylglycine-generating enzyme required for sulfatase activity